MPANLKLEIKCEKCEATITVPVSVDSWDEQVGEMPWETNTHYYNLCDIPEGWSKKDNRWI
jgi:hypothetical protein